MTDEDYRDCVGAQGNDCEYVRYNEFNTPYCSIDGIIQVRYYGCTPIIPKRRKANGGYMEFEIEGRKVKQSDMWSPVTYVPSHLKGNNSHKDCERCVLIQVEPNALGFTDTISVLNCKTRTRQKVNVENLVWG